MEIFRHFLTQKKGRIHRLFLQKNGLSTLPFHADTICIDVTNKIICKILLMPIDIISYALLIFHGYSMVLSVIIILYWAFHLGFPIEYVQFSYVHKALSNLSPLIYVSKYNSLNTS